MAQVTGLGCALGAIIAAMNTVEPDPLIAAAAALDVFGAAGERAALTSRGPGSFAVAMIDALATVDTQMLARRT